MSKELQIRNSTVDFLVFTRDAGEDGIEVRVQNGDVWLTQKAISQLFDVDRSVITKHLSNIFKEGELDENSVCAKFAQTADDGKTYNYKFYSLAAIIAVGYRINSERAMQFRTWATKVLDTFTKQGYVLDKSRLINGQIFDEDYFEHLIAEIQEIRASERRFYQKITDIYATAVDYDKNSQVTREFYATVQNKMHYAVHGNTNSRYRKDGHILSNHLNVRLANYVCLQSSGALLDDIYNYFKSSKMLSEETLQKHYQKFKEAGDKANYYKTDEEIETYIQSWKAKLHEASNSVELTQLAGEYDYWFQVLEKDDDELIEYYRDVLKNMFLCENRSDKRSPLDYYNSNEFHGATEKIRNIYDEVLIHTKKEIIRTYIEKLGDSLDEEIAYEYSYWLKDWYTGTLEMHRYIDEEIDPLYQRNSFPVDNMSKTKKMVCYNVMTLLYLHDKEKLEKCYNSLKSDFSKMGIKRTEDILKEIREDN